MNERSAEKMGGHATSRARAPGVGVKNDMAVNMQRQKESVFENDGSVEMGSKGAERWRLVDERERRCDRRNGSREVAAWPVTLARVGLRPLFSHP